jgi:predicted secreted hydrolase
LAGGEPPVLHGERGYSRKGTKPGNASHYYSLTRMPSAGTLWIDEERVEVTGDSWMDHEWGTSFLEPGQVGWDWFSIQLEDGSDLMLFQIRRSDGSADPFASGTVVDAAGRATHLGPGDFVLRPGTTWTSAGSGARYPIAWRVSVLSMGLDAEVRAAFPAQEMRTGSSGSVTYWEGAIDVSGTRGGRPVRGRGYLEMTGYTGRPMSEVLR